MLRTYAAFLQAEVQSEFSLAAAALDGEAARQLDGYLAALEAGRPAEAFAAGGAQAGAWASALQQAALGMLDRYTTERDTALALARELAAWTGQVQRHAERRAFAALAHDVRSPLNALYGALSMLEAAPERAPRMLEIARSAADDIVATLEAVERKVL